MLSRHHIALLLLLADLLPGCIFHNINVETLPQRVPTTNIETAVRVHLVDGQTAIFPDGFKYAQQTIHGQGYLYDLTLQKCVLIQRIHVDDIAALEVYTHHTNKTASMMITTALVAAIVIVVASAQEATAAAGPILSDILKWK